MARSNNLITIFAIGLSLIFASCDDSTSGNPDDISEYNNESSLPESCKMELAKVGEAYFGCFENNWIEITDPAIIEMIKGDIDEKTLKKRLKELDSLYKNGFNCGRAAFNPDNQFCDDRDGQVYRFVTIGSQTWMAQNLNYADSIATPTLKKGSWCYNDKPENCTKYGRLYIWDAAMGTIDKNKILEECEFEHACYEMRITDPEDICPTGWRMPTIDEWKTLIVSADKKIKTYEYSNEAGRALKASDGWVLEGWKEDEGYDRGLDTYGFSALPAGTKTQGMHYNEETFLACFWSSSPNEVFNNTVDFVYIGQSNRANIERADKTEAFSIRCIKD